MKKHTVNAGWKSYKDAVLEYAPEIQKKECKRAFYAGAHILFYLVTETANVVNEKEACKIFDDLKQEIEDFYKSQTAQ